MADRHAPALKSFEYSLYVVDQRELNLTPGVRTMQWPT